MTNRFILKVQSWINISKSINIIHHINKLEKIEKKKKTTMIILIDAEKSSDRISQ